MSKGASNKRKGSNAERYYAKVFREDLGFAFCKTSRASNRMLDDAGVDLNFLPFNVQIKAGYAKGLNEIKTLDIIRERLPLLFPPYDDIHKKVNILIHKKDTGRGKKKSAYDELVFMRTENFRELFKDANINIIDIKDANINIIDMPIKEGQKRGWSYEEELMKSPEDIMIYTPNAKDSLLVMTFKRFAKLVKTKTKTW